MPFDLHVCIVVQDVRQQRLMPQRALFASHVGGLGSWFRFALVMLLLGHAANLCIGYRDGFIIAVVVVRSY